MAVNLRTLKIKSHKAYKRLVWHRDHDPKPYIRERCAAILKIAEGHVPYAVARSGLLKWRDPDTVYGWLNAYEADGFDGLVARPQGGYRGPNLADHRAEVEDRLRQPPDVAHLDPRAPSPAVAPCRYRLEVVRASFDWLSDYSLSGVWRVLERLGIGWKHGYINYWSPDPQYRTKVRFIEKCLKIVAADPQHNVAIFVDEMSYHRWPTAARDWWPQAEGYPLAVHGNCNNQQWRVIGGLNAYTGQVSYRQNYLVGREQVILFHQQLYQQYRRMDNLFVIEDNWNIHTHPDVQAAVAELPNVTMAWLPTYACWLNPIEKLWKWLRQAILHRHRLSDRWPELKLRVGGFFDQFRDGSDELLRYVGLLGDGRFAKILRA
jgi:transposase